MAKPGNFSVATLVPALYASDMLALGITADVVKFVSVKSESVRLELTFSLNGIVKSCG